MGRTFALPSALPEEDDHESCRALGGILDRIADKWTIMVVGVLSRGPVRFNGIMRMLPGVSHRMLTLTLRGLERDGLVKRTAFLTIPPRVDYELTDLGHSLIQPLGVLADWATVNRPTIEFSRERYDRLVEVKELSKQPILK